VADLTLTATNTALVASGMTLTSGTMYALSGLTSTFNWALAGVVMTAKTGIDYRKYKKGDMTKTEYMKNVKKYALVGSGLIVGSISGMAAGFALGSVIFPGVGSIVGAVAGAIGGTVAGEKLSIKAYASIER
jgi:outer membrane lipoprotein SlyB